MPLDDMNKIYIYCGTVIGVNVLRINLPAPFDLFQDLSASIKI